MKTAHKEEGEKEENDLEEEEKEKNYKKNPTKLLSALRKIQQAFLANGTTYEVQNMKNIRR